MFSNLDKNYKKEIISQLILHKNTILVTFTMILLSGLMLTVSSNIVSSSQTSYAQVDNTRTYNYSGKTNNCE